MKFFFLISFMLASVCLFGLCGCQQDDVQLARMMQSEDPNVRLKAIDLAGNNSNQAMVPYLVDRLSDTEEDVRFYAFLALNRITGKTMGYEYFGTQQKRAEAIQRWRVWLSAGRPATMPTSFPTTGPDFIEEEGNG